MNRCRSVRWRRWRIVRCSHCRGHLKTRGKGWHWSNRTGYAWLVH